MKLGWLAAGVLAITVAGCGDDEDTGGKVDAQLAGDAGDSGAADANTTGDACVARTPVDILFVIDNSATMAGEQAALAAAFQSLVDRLSLLPGGLPDLHIGIVTSDMGSGTFNVPSCGTTGGDRGILQNDRRVGATCTPPTTDRFLSDAPGAGGRVKNYQGTLAEAFSCIAVQGDTGCGFEQHLEAMKRALDGSNVENAGFLREGANLVVVFLADEDDCSAKPGGALYDSTATALGPLSSFRCFEQGIVCNPDMPRTEGAKSMCMSREDSAYLPSVQSYSSFLLALKGGDQGRVAVISLLGPATPVTVMNDAQSRPALQPACTGAAGTAAPAVRLGALTASRGVLGLNASICDPFAPTLTAAGDLIARFVGQCR